MVSKIKFKLLFYSWDKILKCFIVDYLDWGLYFIFGVILIHCSNSKNNYLDQFKYYAEAMSPFFSFEIFWISLHSSIGFLFTYLVLMYLASKLIDPAASWFKSDLEVFCNQHMVLNPNVIAFIHVNLKP